MFCLLSEDYAMNEKNNTLPLILAFLAGVVIAAMVAFAVVRQQGPPRRCDPCRDRSAAAIGGGCRFSSKGSELY